MLKTNQPSFVNVQCVTIASLFLAACGALDRVSTVNQPKKDKPEASFSASDADGVWESDCSTIELAGHKVGIRSTLTLQGASFERMAVLSKEDCLGAAVLTLTQTGRVAIGDAVASNLRALAVTDLKTMAKGGDEALLNQAEVCGIDSWSAGEERDLSLTWCNSPSSRRFFSDEDQDYNGISVNRSAGQIVLFAATGTGWSMDAASVYHLVK